MIEFKPIVHCRTVFSANFNSDKIRKQKLLIISDLHFDSKHCQRKLLKKHLDQALEDKALIMIIGDVFDVMGTFRDPRSKPSQIRPEYLKNGSYLDLIINDAYSFFKPYANNILMISTGNHETNIMKRHDSDIIDRLVFLLRTENPKIIRGGYSGWMIFNFRQADGTRVRKKIIKFHHGEGGNAKRSKGVLQIDIDSSRWPDADIIVKGHDHMKWYYPSEVRQRINNSAKQYKDVQHHIRLGSYKDGTNDGFEGWEVENNFKDTKMGGWWVTFDYFSVSGALIAANQIKIEVTEAN